MLQCADDDEELAAFHPGGLVRVETISALSSASLILRFLTTRGHLIGGVLPCCPWPVRCPYRFLRLSGILRPIRRAGLTNMLQFLVICAEPRRAIERAQPEQKVSAFDVAAGSRHCNVIASGALLTPLE